MAKLQFLDIDNEIKDIADIDSPSFIGEGITVNPIETNNPQIINFRFIKRLLEKALNEFNIETLESNSNSITNLVPGADYIVNLYGINSLTCNPDFPYNTIRSNTYPENYVYDSNNKKVYINETGESLPKGYVKIGYFAILNKANKVIGKTDIRVKKIDWPNNNASFPDSATIKITAPIDGFIYGFLNYGMTFANPIPVKYMNAIKINNVKINTFRASIVQQTNQTIIVTVNGVDYKENFNVLPGSEFTTRSEGYPGYRGGVISPASGTFNRNILFTASPATPTTYTATIIQKPHQTVTVTYNGNNYTSTISNIPLNSLLIIRITNVEYGYISGRVNKTNIKVKEDITIEPTDATPIPYTITIIQEEREIIRVAYKTRIYTESFDGEYNEKISITVSAIEDEIYMPGHIIITGNYITTEVANEYIITGQISITASSVSPISN